MTLLPHLPVRLSSLMMSLMKLGFVGSDLVVDIVYEILAYQTILEHGRNSLEALYRLLVEIHMR